MRKSVVFKRETSAVKIPSGESVEIAEGTEGFVVQARSGNATVRIPSRMWQVQVSADQIDALEGSDGEVLDLDLGEPRQYDGVPADMRGAVYEALEECYDPEIPVNIVDLGLVYDVTLTEHAEDSYEIHVKMTLTAPGCGMGDHLARQAEQRIREIPGAEDVEVEIVWDPRWTEEMMSETAKQKLGFQ